MAMSPWATASAPPPLHRDHALFIDFDGTLVEYATSPAAVEVAPDLPQRLNATLTFLDGAAAIVSGRALDDLCRRLAPFAGTIVGQHGLECRRPDGSITRWPAEPALESVRALLADFAAQHDGALLEDKGRTVALHYRDAPHLATLCRDAACFAVDISRGAFEAMSGHMIVELVPRGAGKGGAIAALMATAPFHGRQPVFIGDDTGDEEGFAVVNHLGGVSILVGDRPTAAIYRLATVGAVMGWLSQSIAQ